MTFCHLTDILHKAFFGFLGRLGQYFIAEFADVETCLLYTSRVAIGVIVAILSTIAFFGFILWLFTL